MKLRTLTLLLSGALVLWSAVGCERKHGDPIAGGGNSETHFLEECTDSCPGGLACVCGVCTVSCTEASDCGGLRADATCVAACTGAPSTLMCDLPCGSNTDCAELGPSASCQAGRCRFGSGDGGAGGGGAGTAGSNTGKGGSSGATSNGGKAGAGGTGATNGGDGGAPDASGATGASAASGAGESNGGGAGAGSGNGGSGLGPVEVTDAASFRLAQWSVLCQKLFDCPVKSDDDYGSQLAFGTPERCVDVIMHSPLYVAADRDLDEKLAAGDVGLESAQVAPCLEGLSDCATGWGTDSVPACRAVFRGNSPLGGPCSRPEDCADDVSCVIDATCPGTCTAATTPTLKGIGESCSTSAECDPSPGDVECVRLLVGYGATCELVTRFAPAELDGPCSWGYGPEIRPCVEGLVCDGNHDIPSGSSPDLGACHTPIPAGATCGDYAHCQASTFCIDGICQTFFVANHVGDVCNDTTYCNPVERLTCNEGVCELVGDGADGARCRALDLAAHVSCNTGLVCLDPDPATPADANGITWGHCGVPRPAGEPCVGNDDCASEHCLADHTCGDAYCCNDYGCQSN